MPRQHARLPSPACVVRPALPCPALPLQPALTGGVGEEPRRRVGQPLRLHRQRVLANEVELGWFVGVGGTLRQMAGATCRGHRQQGEQSGARMPALTAVHCHQIFKSALSPWATKHSQ